MPKKSKLTWKRNLRKIPDALRVKLRAIKTGSVVAAVTKKIRSSTVGAGVYSHLHLGVANGEPTFPGAVMPPASAGKYSDRNRNGEEVIRKDLPMETRTYSWVTPNWGDWSRGSHSTHQDRDVYRRDFIPPKELMLRIELLATEKGDDPIFVFKFSLDEVLDPKARKFKDDLLYNLNLLQENVGVVGVFASNATADDYLKTIYVAWEILPPGERDATIARILSQVKGGGSEELKAKVVDRYDTLSKLKPQAFIAGSSGFQRYFGAKFAEDLVVFENLEYGNAIYVMYRDWEKLSQRSRTELLKNPGAGFERIVHAPGWKTQLKKVVQRGTQPGA
jgi:hypothetical protein